MESAAGLLRTGIRGRETVPKPYHVTSGLGEFNSLDGFFMDETGQTENGLKQWARAYVNGKVDPAAESSGTVGRDAGERWHAVFVAGVFGVTGSSVWSVRLCSCAISVCSWV